MFDKIKTTIHKHELTALRGGVIILGGALIYKMIEVNLQKEMFHQVEESVRAMGLEEEIVAHMNEHVYPKL